MIRSALSVSLAPVLALALTACGQADTPEPATPAAATAPAATPPATLPAAPQATLAGLETALRGLHADDGALTYASASVDLNGDGSDEVLAYVMGPMVCGSGGCNLYVLAREGEGWRVVTRTSVTQTPVGVLTTSTNGWRDLAVSIGGGGAQAGWVRLTYDGRTYPTNPTAPPATPLVGQPDVTTLIASEPDARPLP
ncbi:hypothetical protein [uncultured Brevundimonas sp.]|uniref:hypothetical protein n=1 Tax=uncultured Brevundimonas sp. TaxID=213418 RepID=UPI0025EE5B4A|nr:hypothetical protein [uncultured Brevundimonas sp.]